MCNKITPKNLGGGCLWGRQCFPGGCAGAPQTIGCEDLGGACFNCAVGGAFHSGDVSKIPEKARMVVRIIPGVGSLVTRAAFDNNNNVAIAVGRLIVSVAVDDGARMPANEATWVWLESQPGVVTWGVLDSVNATVELLTIARSPSPD